MKGKTKIQAPQILIKGSEGRTGAAWDMSVGGGWNWEILLKNAKGHNTGIKTILKIIDMEDKE